VNRDPAHSGSTAVSDRAPSGLVVTSSSNRPPADLAGERWRRRPGIAATIRFVVIATPLVASICAGIAASRIFRPTGWLQISAWILWTATASIAVLAAVDAVVRRLLPLQRLLQLHLVFPDKAPSRLRVAARAARLRRSDRLSAAQHHSPEDPEDAVTHIVTLLGALAAHDRRTRGHSERVCVYTELIAEEMELPQRDRDRLMWVALIHDIGKLEVPPRLLNKPARPTLPEWQVLRSHPHHGDRMIASLRPWLGSFADAVVQHHERYDGLGYPNGLYGDELCIGARIIAVADAFEVMTAPRPYRRPVDAAAARSELARHAGTQFDPEIVRHFLAVGLPQLSRSMGLLSWLGQVPFIREWPKLQSTTGVAATQATTATLVASSAGAMWLGPAGIPPAVAHDVSAAPLSHAATAPLVAEPMPPRRHLATPKRAAPPAPAATATAVVTGSSSSGGTVAVVTPTKHAAPVASTCSTTPGRGHHYGWKHRRTPPPARHNGC
jgi:HD-GYP domain-containing protein (c-di-GMP phosphodiesterase class II)